MTKFYGLGTKKNQITCQGTCYIMAEVQQPLLLFFPRKVLDLTKYSRIYSMPLSRKIDFEQMKSAIEMIKTRWSSRAYTTVRLERNKKNVKF